MPDKLNIHDVTVRITPYSEFKKAIHKLRHDIFTVEQGVPQCLDEDGEDPNCYHVLAFDKSGNPIGTARMEADGHLGRMVVLKKWRRKGVGTKMLHALIDYAVEIRLDLVYLNSQLYAVPFYEASGFRQASAVFYEASMPHVTMQKTLLYH